MRHAITRPEITVFNSVESIEMSADIVEILLERRDIFIDIRKQSSPLGRHDFKRFAIAICIIGQQTRRIARLEGFLALYQDIIKLDDLVRRRQFGDKTQLNTGRTFGQHIGQRAAVGIKGLAGQTADESLLVAAQTEIFLAHFEHVEQHELATINTDLDANVIAIATAGLEPGAVAPIGLDREGQ